MILFTLAAGSAAAANGMTSTITASLAAGAVSVGVDGMAGTVTASLAAGSAAAANGITGTITASFAPGAASGA